MVLRVSLWTLLIHFLFLIAPLRSHHDGLTYSDLVALNATCRGLDSCAGSRQSEDLRVVNCQCGSRCMQLGTCCIDSEYRADHPPETNEVPAKLYGSNETVFMVRVCGEDADPGVKDLCEIEDYEGYSDPFLLVPVSDMLTGIVYRNYYCFVCNEKNNTPASPLLWDLKLYVESNGEPIPSVESFPDLRYQWGQFLIQDQFAHIMVEPPKEVDPQINWSREDVISKCAEGWKDTKTEESCEAYMAMVYIPDEYKIDRYQNPHCAICNYKNVSDLACSEPGGYRAWGGPLDGLLLVGSFSLQDEANRCPVNEVFDKFAQVCRVARCMGNEMLVDGDCMNNRASGESTTKASVWSDNTIFPGSQPPFPKQVSSWVTYVNSSTERELPELPVTPSSTKYPVTSRESDHRDHVYGTPDTKPFSDRDPPKLPETPLATENPIIVLNPMSSHPDDVRFTTDPFTGGDRPELPATPLPTKKPITTYFRGTSKPSTFGDKVPKLPETVLTTESLVTKRPHGFHWTSNPYFDATRKPSKQPGTSLPTRRPMTTRNPHQGHRGGVRVNPGPGSRPKNFKTPLPAQNPTTTPRSPHHFKTPLPTQSPTATRKTPWFQPEDFQWTWDYNDFPTKKPTERPKTPSPAIRPVIIRYPSSSDGNGEQEGPVPSTGRFRPLPDLRLDVHTFNQTTRPKGIVVFVFYDK